MAEVVIIGFIFDGRKVEPTHKNSSSTLSLKKCNEISVNKQCCVQFSIGKNLQEQVLCDVVPMDACHILLGRPWQFDGKAVYDGYRNTYSFQHSGRTMVLIPFKEDSMTKPSKVGNKPPSKIETEQTLLFLQSLKITQQGLVIILLNENEPQAQHPTEVKNLLHEFSPVFPDQLPNGLPPIREEQHAINFIPGSVIPNKPTYPMLPKN